MVNVLESHPIVVVRLGVSKPFFILVPVLVKADHSIYMTLESDIKSSTVPAAFAVGIYPTKDRHTVMQ